MAELVQGVRAEVRECLKALKQAQAWAKGAKVEDVVGQALEEARDALDAQLQAIRERLADAQLPLLRHRRVPVA